MLTEKEEEINEEALKELVKLLNNLENKKVTKFLNSFLEKSDEIVDALISWLNRPENTNTIQNLFLILGFSKNVQFEKLQKIVKALAYGINRGYEEIKNEKKIGLLGLIKSLNDPDINRSVRVTLAILKEMGKKLKDLE